MSKNYKNVCKWLQYSVPMCATDIGSLSMRIYVRYLNLITGKYNIY